MEDGFRGAAIGLVDQELGSEQVKVRVKVASALKFLFLIFHLILISQSISNLKPSKPE